MKHGVGNYSEDNSKTAKSDEDDMGLPENPVYSNFAKYLWHTRSQRGGAQSPSRSHGHTAAPRPTQGAPAAAAEPKPVAAEKSMDVAVA
jgi:hypothetical protein